jgi:hypothetical protein
MSILLSVVNYKDIELYFFIKPIFLKYKRCSYPNPLIDKEKAIISDGLSNVAPLFNERCNYNAMIEYVTIRKLKG